MLGILEKILELDGETVRFTDYKASVDRNELRTSEFKVEVNVTKCTIRRKLFPVFELPYGTAKNNNTVVFPPPGSGSANSSSSSGGSGSTGNPKKTFLKKVNLIMQKQFTY
jgi:hypothetical protein